MENINYANKRSNIFLPSKTLNFNCLDTFININCALDLSKSPNETNANYRKRQPIRFMVVHPFG